MNQNVTPLGPNDFVVVGNSPATKILDLNYFEGIFKKRFVKYSRKGNTILANLRRSSEEGSRYLDLFIKEIDGKLLADMVGTGENLSEVPAEKAVNDFFERKRLFFPED